MDSSQATAGAFRKTRPVLALVAVLLIAAVASSTAIASPEPPPPGTPPSLTGLSRTNQVFLPSYLRQGTGSQLPNRTVFSFFMNQEAEVRVVIKRVLAGGRLGGRGQIFRIGGMGKNRVRFEGVTSYPDPTALRLTPGRYKAFFHSRNEFGSSPVAAIGFRIAKPPRP